MIELADQCGFSWESRDDIGVAEHECWLEAVHCGDGRRHQCHCGDRW